MKRTFYKSLDHPFELFGIKGNWVKMVLYFAGGGLIAALLLGSAFGSGFGVFILVVSIFGGFFYCLSKQKTTLTAGSPASGSPLVPSDGSGGGRPLPEYSFPRGKTRNKSVYPVICRLV